VTLVHIGNVNESSAVNISSRSIWNEKTDDYVTAKFRNRSIYALAVIYTLYKEWQLTTILFYVLQLK